MVRFLGYTIYNAKRRAGASEWDMAGAHFDYARQIPATIAEHLPSELSAGISEASLRLPIGEMSVMHSHNTFPSHAQKYHSPMWELPNLENLEASDSPTIQASREKYYETKKAYRTFAADVIARIDALAPTGVPKP
jgi:hypothetical protein